MEEIYQVYTDGSYQNGKAAWGFVVVLQPTNTMIYEESGIVEDKEAVAQIWNVAAEIEAAIKAIDWAVKNEKQIILISDYQGIQGWADNWRTNNEWSAAYSFYAKKNKKFVKEFKFVKGHSKNQWNEYVDKLVFNELNKKENKNG